MPLTLDLQRKDPRHQTLIRQMDHLLAVSKSRRREFYDQCAEREKSFYAYIEEPEFEKKRRDQKGKPDYKTIMVPYSYAAASTAHTYYSSVFLSRSPIFQLQGRHGETEEQVQAMEALLAYQVTAGRQRPALYHWLADQARLGFGVVETAWEERRSMIAELVQVPDGELGSLTGRTKIQKTTREVIEYQGNSVTPVRSYDWIWDTRFGQSDFQRGEYCGYYTFLTDTELAAGIADGSFIQSSTEWLRTWVKDPNRAEDRGPGVFPQIEEEQGYYGNYRNQGNGNGARIIVFHWTLIPSQWGLGSSNRPEKWVFGYAEDEVIIFARPLGCFHNQYPFSVLTFDIDNFRAISRSLIDLTEPMENTMTWLLNSHFYNVRQHLNNTFLADPTKIVMKDIYKRGPGGVIRLKPTGMGENIDSFFKQLQLGDVTQAHVEDLNRVEQLGQRITGINDNVMGMVNPGGRKTATEIRTSSSFSTNRLKTQAEWMSETGWAPLARQQIQNTQQYMEGRMKLSLSGDLIRTPVQAVNMIEVDINDIAGFYDFEPVDGTLPIDRFAMASTMQELFSTAAQIPEIGASYDLPGLFNYVAQLAGARSLERFKVQVTSDDLLMDQVQAGNVVALRDWQAQQSGGPTQSAGVGSQGFPVVAGRQGVAG